jgi:hypothetical protein
MGQRLSLQCTFFRSTRFLVVFVLTLTASFAASAAPKDRKEIAAKRACLAGDYAKGVGLLADLYIASGDINHLYNQGRCFEQNGKFEEAIVRFLEYQRKNKDKGNPDDPEAEKHIAECQAWIDKHKPAGGAAAVTPAVASSPAAGTTASADLSAAKTAVRAGSSALATEPAAAAQPAVVGPSSTAAPLAAPVVAVAPASASGTGANLPPASAAPGQIPVAPALDLAAQAAPNEAGAPVRPIYKKWWFWSGVGAVTAGAVTTAILLLGKSSSNVPSSSLGNQGAF